MRLRLAMPASLLALLAVAVMPTIGSAAPHHNHGLTINATPNPIVSGDEVLIYGQLNLAQPAHRLIKLYHRVDANHFSFVQSTTTDGVGFYKFTRADDVVSTNRSWYVTGPNATHSRTVEELVAAEVTLKATPLDGDTNQVVTLTGHVTPNNAGHRVLLQAQRGRNGDDWQTIASSRLGPDSNYKIAHKFAMPGERDLRVLFVGDRRDGENISAYSTPVTVTIDQNQNRSFTIHATPKAVNSGSPVMISGILYKKGSTSTPDPGQTVQLWGHDADHPYAEITSTTTLGDGSYHFAQTPTFNEVYQVRTITTPVRKSAQVFEGVRSLVTLNPLPPTATVGQTVNFTGSVSPDKSGRVIYLQRLGADGDWHTVKESRVSIGSTYSIPWKFGSPGVKQFRTLVPGSELNATGASAPVAITVLLPAVQTLPPAS